MCWNPAPPSSLRHASWEMSPEASSSGDEDAREEKRRRFAEKRRSHYQMKEALRRFAVLRSANRTCSTLAAFCGKWGPSLGACV